MNRRQMLRIALGSSAAALVAAAGLAVASPTLAQGVSAINPAAALSADAERGRGPLGRGGMQLSAVATALGMTEAELRTELEAGKSVADVAAAKNVSLDAVTNAIVDARTQELAQAVTDGKLTQAQADALISNLKLTLPGQLQTKMVPGLQRDWDGGRGGRGHGDKGGGIRTGAQLATVATALGVTQAELWTELQAGKSVADVAAAKNVALDTVINAIVAEQTAALQLAVTNGRLTQAQADERIASLKANLPTLLAQPGLFQRGPGRVPNAPAATPAPGA